MTLDPASDINKLEQKIQARRYTCTYIYLRVWARLLGAAPQIWTPTHRISPVLWNRHEEHNGGNYTGLLQIALSILCTHMPAKHEMSAFSLPTWWLLNLFLVSFDKPLCSQRDIPLTQPLVIVYTSSHQSGRTLSGFASNIHFASEIQYRKWLDHLSFPLQLLPSSSPTVFPLTLTSFGIVDMTRWWFFYKNSNTYIFDVLWWPILLNI